MHIHTMGRKQVFILCHLFVQVSLQREQDRAAWRFPQEKSAAREEMRHLCLSLISKLRCKFLCSSVKSSYHFPT
ncbi:SMC5-SMC6 complex localization factor protein 2 [Manis javanica]|nr:SMC5-SMC6 complex localization factor protein 2 [Manis javanica]